MQTRPLYKATKRLLDIAIAGLGLVVLAPVIVLIALLIRLVLGSPVVFRQPRPGLRAEIFECLKFRTMTNDRDQAGELLPDAMRLGGFGRFLRRASLDELPQLWSVLTGDMSLVGPRPLMVRYLPRYSAEQHRRHLVPPGITGWAQINGRNAIDWDRKLALDVWYVDNCSLSLDLRILLRTLWIVISAAGVSRPGQVSMDEFLGTTGNE